MPINLDETEIKNNSIGAKRVRLDFNVSNSGIVNIIKVTAAILINYCEQLKQLDPRCASIAQTHIETGCMYAVKAATATATEETMEKKDGGI